MKDLKKHSNFVLASIIIGCILFQFAQPARSQEIEIHSNVSAIISDGISLKHDLYIPSTEGKYPTILLRTPYNKKYKSSIGKWFAENGYAVVIQDTRGKYMSEGAYFPLHQEKRDGLETLDWIINQEWSDGNVGMYGSSYGAFCGLVLGPENHPALKTVVSLSGFSDGYNIIYPSGSLNLLSIFSWIVVFDRPGQSDFDQFGFDSVLQSVPINKMSSHVDDYIGNAWHTLMNHPYFDPYFEAISTLPQADKIKIPILQFAGWNDWIYHESIDLYQALRSNNPQIPHKLIVGPWTHNQNYDKPNKFGDEVFGENSGIGENKTLEITLEWFDRFLKLDKKESSDEIIEKSVDYFVMNSNNWESSDNFPPSNVTTENWYLTSNGNANSRLGDGVLSKQKPDKQEKDSYVYDPFNPVPTTGGNNFHFYSRYNRITDQSENELRKDILVYTSDELDENIKICGTVDVSLFFKTNARDTDFTAKLVEVRANGYARNIIDGIGKTRFRDNQYKTSPMLRQDSIYNINFSIGSTAIEVQKGSKLRLEISSSNFPKFARNPNTGEHEIYAKEYVSALQEIIHSPILSSKITIPVLR